MSEEICADRSDEREEKEAIERVSALTRRAAAFSNSRKTTESQSLGWIKEEEEELVRRQKTKETVAVKHALPKVIESHEAAQKGFVRIEPAAKIQLELQREKWRMYSGLR